MLELQLDIEDSGGTVHTYGNDRLLSPAAVTDVSVDDLNVRQDTVDLFLGQDDANQAEVAGYTDPLAIPADTTWRARITVQPSGDVVLDGAVVTADLEYDDHRNGYRVRVINQAVQDFWSTLDSWLIPELVRETALISPIPDSRTLQVQERVDDTGYYEERERIVTEMRVLLQSYLSRLQMTWDMPASMTGSGDRLWVYMGRWTAGRFVRQVSRLAGWRVIPSYQGFPSSDLHVTFVPASWPTGSFTDVDSDEVERGYRIGRDTPEEPFSLRTANDVCESSPDPREVQLDKIALPSGSFPTFAPPLSWAIEAPTSWDADPPVIESAFNTSDVRLFDARSMQTSAQELRWGLAPIEIVNTESSFMYGRPLVPDRTHEPYGVDTIAFDPERAQDEVAYVFQLHQDTTTSEWFAVWVDINNKATPLDPWAGGAWAQHAQRRGTRAQLIGEYAHNGNTSVGDPAAGVNVEGVPWVIHSERRDLQRDTREWSLRRSIASVNAPDVPAPPSNRPWTVLKLEVEIQTTAQPGGDADWLLAHWERTPTRHAAEWLYNVELIDEDTGTTLDSGSTQATAYTFELAAPGSGGQTYDLRLEVTPTAHDGTLGDTATASIDTTQGDDPSLGWDWII